MMRRVLTIIFAVPLVAQAGFFSLAFPEQCVGQSISTLDYDYESLAIDSILSVADEAGKLPDIEQKVTLLISAATLLPASRRDDAIRLLDIALGKLKDPEFTEKAKWGQRYKAAALRNKVLSVYAKLDSKKALALQKESESRADPGENKDNVTARQLRDQGWSAGMLERQQRASASAKIALSILDTDFDRASALIIQSVKGGAVPFEIFTIFQKLKQPGDRARLNKLENMLGETLAQTFTLDPFSLKFAPILIPSDRDMPSIARRGLILFLMNSLRTWVNLVKDEIRNGGLDASYVGSTFTAFSLQVRSVITQYSPPEELSTFDLLLDQVSPLVPSTTKVQLQITAPETISNPQERLADILKESNTERRDIRLMRLVFDFTRDAKPDQLVNGLELASDAIGRIGNVRLKAALGDYVIITRVNLLTQEKKFDKAERLADSIPATEARTWALLALSSVTHKEDGARSLDLIRSAIKALDSASPSVRKVELAILAATMLAKDDPLRALEMLSVAVRYANSNLRKVEIPRDDIVSAINLEASVGNMSVRLNREPESLSEIEIPPSLFLLGKSNYWFQSQPIVSEFKEAQLRLSLKLVLAKGLLTYALKQPKDAVQKPSSL